MIKFKMSFRDFEQAMEMYCGKDLYTYSGLAAIYNYLMVTGREVSFNRMDCVFSQVSVDEYPTLVEKEVLGDLPVTNMSTLLYHLDSMDVKYLISGEDSVILIDW